ncbi:MAG: TIGR02678 family protein, partial [Burkholderiales bacterium]
QRDEERERALRALLMRPLLAEDNPDLALVRRHAEYLRDWFAREAGWTLRIERGCARLYKRPAVTGDDTRGLPGFDRDRYVLLCLACSVLERAELQITLRALGERLLEAVADPELEARGFAFTLEPVRERRALVQVCRFLLEHGVLSRVAGDEEAYVNKSGDVLYDVNRRVLAALPASTRGASYIAAAAEGAVAPTGFAERLAALIDEYVPDSAEGQRTAARHRLARRLLDDPATYHDELTDEERQYLATQRGPMAARLAQATGLVSELRAEGVALIDPDSELTDERLPAVGTEAHATLLVAEYLARTAGVADDGSGQRAAPPGKDAAPTGTAGSAGMLHSLAELAAFLREATDEYGRYWRRAAREPGAEAELAAQAVARLERLKLVRRVDEAIEARPALFRYRVHAAEVQSQQALL